MIRDCSVLLAATHLCARNHKISFLCPAYEAKRIGVTLCFYRHEITSVSKCQHGHLTSPNTESVFISLLESKQEAVAFHPIINSPLKTIQRFTPFLQMDEGLPFKWNFLFVTIKHIETSCRGLESISYLLLRRRPFGQPSLNVTKMSYKLLILELLFNKFMHFPHYEREG